MIEGRLQRGTWGAPRRGAGTAAETRTRCVPTPPFQAAGKFLKSVNPKDEGSSSSKEQSDYAVDYFYPAYNPRTWLPGSTR